MTYILSLHGLHGLCFNMTVSVFGLIEKSLNAKHCFEDIQQIQEK